MVSGFRVQGFVQGLVNGLQGLDFYFESKFRCFELDVHSLHGVVVYELGSLFQGLGSFAFRA